MLLQFLTAIQIAIQIKCHYVTGILLLLLLQTSTYSAEKKYATFFCSPLFPHVLIQSASKIDYTNFDTSQALDGWLDFITIVTQPDFCAQQQVSQLARVQLLQWHQRYPQHSINYHFPSLFQQHTNQPHLRHILLLLPMQQPLAPYSKALEKVLRELFAAHKIQLSLIDTSKAQWLHKFSMRMPDCDCVIGPLQHDKIAKISQQTLLKPVLSLKNIHPEKIRSDYFFMFSGLRQNQILHMTRQLTQQSYQQGLLLYNSRKSRYKGDAEILIHQFQQNYGNWVAVRKLPDNHIADFMAQALNLSASQQRYQKLSQIIGKKPVFLKRPRQDIDFVIIFDDSNRMAQIYPLLRYWYLDKVAVYTHADFFYQQDSLSRYDRQGLHIPRPLWLNQQIQTPNHNQIILKLITMAQLLHQLILQSQCLKLEHFYRNNMDKQWHFEPKSGLFSKIW